MPPSSSCSPAPAIPELAGAFAPILTPFTSDGGSLDLESYGRQLAFLEEAGLTGVLVLGTNGEFGYLAYDDKIRLIETTLAAGTSLKVLVGGVVPDSPDETLTFVARLAEYADQVTAVLVPPPFYDVVAAGGTVSDEHLVDFCRQLAQVQDRLPLMLYNVPVPPSGPLTAAITPGVVAALSDEGTIVGVKDSTARLENIPAYLAAKPGLQVLVGSDHVVAGGLARGAVGSITAGGNVFPSAVLTVYRSDPGPDREAAQAELSRLRNVLELVPGKMVATQKLLVHWLGVVPRRSPVRDLSKSLTAREADQVWEYLEETAAGLVVNRAVQEQVARIATGAGTG